MNSLTRVNQDYELTEVKRVDGCLTMERLLYYAMERAGLPDCVRQTTLPHTGTTLCCIIM